jgi:peptidoglycan hydrolase-like protein with peptidoglycan-binding domain
MLRSPACVILALALLCTTPALAQTPPTVPSAGDAALAAQKTAFLALPEATRKAVQDALIWLGFYNGAADADFGKRTRDAILAFQASAKAPEDGVLTPAELQALLAGAQKARDAVGFQAISDARSGASIGAPTKLIGPRSGTKLDFASSSDADLDAPYTRLSAPAPGRRIAYRAIKPGVFFVVSGQEGTSTFYTRFDKNAAASPPIRGFTFSYPTAQAARLDRVALAVANSFVAFPEPAKAQAGSAAATAGVAPGPGSGSPAPNPAPAATALIVAPGKALTALKADECLNPTVGGKPIRIERTDTATHLAIIAGDLGAAGEAPRFGAPAADVVVVGFAGTRLAASPATLADSDGRPAIVAAVETSGGGAPVFDRRGALVGLVAPIAEEPKRVAGVTLAALHPIIAPEAIRAFLGAGESAPDGAAALSAGDIAARERHAVVAVFCRK